MLSYEEQMLEKEKNSLTQLNSIKNNIEERLQNLKKEKQNKYESYQQQGSIGLTALELRSYNFFCENINKQIKQMEKDLLVAKVAAENQRKVVVVASQKVEKLVKLEEKQKEEYDYSMLKKEEEVIAEFVSTEVIRHQCSSL